MKAKQGAGSGAGLGAAQTRPATAPVSDGEVFYSNLFNTLLARCFYYFLWEERHIERRLYILGLRTIGRRKNIQKAVQP